MPRYVMASRRAGKFTKTEKLDATEAFSRFRADTVDAADTMRVVAEKSPRGETDRRIAVFEATEAQAAGMIATAPQDVIIEPEIIYRPMLPLPFGFEGTSRVSRRQDASVLGEDAQIAFEVRGGGGGLAHAKVLLTIRFGSTREVVEGETDASGRVTLSYPSFASAAAAIVIPYSGFWPMVVQRPRQTQRVTCPALPGGSPFGWWHTLLGAPRRYDETLGAGLKVGVIDTGCGPNGNIAHARSLGAALNGGYDPTPDAGLDVAEHGSHVCGTIGARPGDAGGFAGLAPGVDLMSVRVFPTPDGASNADIAEAIDVLSRDNDADLINMSLGGPTTSFIVGDAIEDAFERGTLCIAAAANSGGPVNFPARHRLCVAVSALGLLGNPPVGSLSATRVPSAPQDFGDDSLFIANFSCRGPEIELAGPGVGIVATVPERHGTVRPQAALDGTSMASPAVTGALAAILSRNPTWATLQRNEGRAAFARTIAETFARSISLDATLQGHGVPTIRGMDASRSAVPMF